MSLLNPHEVRLAARSAKYDNTEDERANLGRVDRAVFERVALFELGVVETARAHADKGDRLANSAVMVRSELHLRFIAAAENGSVTRELLRDFNRVRATAEATASSLEVAERATDWHASRLGDVYGAWLALVEKYPTLRPGIPIQ